MAMEEKDYFEEIYKKKTKIDVDNRLSAGENLSFFQLEIDEYEIKRQIGSGATGIVYEAYQKQLNRRVAIKILKPHLCKNKVILERFKREGKAIAKLKHENIASVYDFVSRGNLHYIVMEYIEGIELEELLKIRKRIPVEEAVDIVIGILRGLNIAHKNGIIHRDIKPSNIIINKNGTPVLFDFGLAKLKDEVVKTISNLPIGTPYYMAPEQFSEKSKITPKTDLFSLGVLFYEMLAGELPFQGETFSSVMNKILNQDPLPPSKINSAVPKKLDRIVLKLLEKNPKERYKNANEVLEDLDCFKNNLPLKNIKNWPLNTLKKYVYKYVLKNTYVLFSLVLLFSFLMAYGVFKYFEYKSEKSFWVVSYDFAPSYFLQRDWAFFEGFHKESLLFHAGKKQLMIPIKDKSILINTSSSLFGVYTPVNSNEVKIRCSFKGYMKLNPKQISRLGIFVSSKRSHLSGYIFYVTGRKLYFAKNYIENIIYEAGIDPLELLKSRINMEIRKKADTIDMYFNGKRIFTYIDFTPLSSPEYGYCGFLAENLRTEINNLEIMLPSIPAKTTPVIIAKKLIEIGEYEEALKVYKDIERDVKDKKIVLQSRYQTGVIKFKLEKYDEAVKDFMFVLRNAKSNILKSKTYYQLSLLYLKTKEVDKAFSFLIKAKNIGDSNAVELNIVAGIIEFIRSIDFDSKERVDYSNLIVKFMIRNFPEYKFSFIHEAKEIALFYFIREDFEKAVEEFKYLAVNFSERRDLSAWAYLMIGECYLKQEKFEEALNVFNYVIRNFRNQKWLVVWALHKKAAILSDMGKEDESTDILKEIIENYKNSSSVKNTTDGLYDDIIYKSYLELQKIKDKY